MHQARLVSLVVATALLLAACGAGSPPTPSPSAATSRSPAPAASTAAAVTFAGAWEGDLVDANGSYPIRLSLDGCTTDGATCGELEYGDPAVADVVFCASELSRKGVDDDVLSLKEHLVYRPWMCFESAFDVHATADGGLAIEQLAGDGDVCCRGTLERIGDTLPPTPTPALGPVEGLGRTTASVALGGAGTQYAAGAEGSVWVPLEDRGLVARVDAATAEIQALVEAGDPAAIPDMMSDPHGVATGDAGIWVGQAATQSVGRIDLSTNKIAESIPVSVRPYALALDGKSLWLTSFLDDRVVHVDLASGDVIGEISVTRPAGIAVGFGGVWVVEHLDDTIARIDPATNDIVAEIKLGERGPNERCGMCVENVVVGDDAVWTANNEARSVSRIDPGSNEVAATIDLPLRVWAVSAGGGSVWASQFEASPDGGFADTSTWAVAAIDPATNQPTSYPFDGAYGVTWGEDALWVLVPGRRGDGLARVEVDR